MKYTIFIARPDNPYDDYYGDHVEADTVKEAQEIAKRNAWEADTEDSPEDRPEADSDEEYDEIERYRVLFVFEGHISDISERW